MKKYTITRKTGDWSNAPIARIDTLLWTKETSITAQAQLCYDDTALYVRMSATEEHIRAVETSITGMPCEDSCLEFFFSPDGTRYFNIEFNPNCCMYLGLGGTQLVRLLPDNNVFAPKAQRTENGWQVEYNVPFTFIRHFFPDFAPQSGDTITGNFYKCGDLTAQEHYLAWNPCTSETPCFHNVNFFGTLEFE